MKFYKILILLLIIPSIIIFISCSDKNEQSSEIIIKDGLIYEEGSAEPFTGKVVDEVKDKIIEYDVVNGIKDGDFIITFKNGKPEMIGQIKKNKNEGLWKYYFLSGQIESEGEFKNDLPDGKWKWYYENGELKEEGFFERGKKINTWILYDEDGNVKEEKVVEEVKEDSSIIFPN